MQRKSVFQSQNIIAANDTIIQYKLKNNAILYSKALLLSENKTLKGNNAEYLKQLKKQGASIISLTDIIGTLAKEGGEGHITPAEIINDTTYAFNINDTINTLSLNGQYEIKTKDNIPKFGKLILNSWSTNINLSTGIYEENKILKSFVTSKDTSLKINNIETTLFDPKNSEVYKDLFQKTKYTFGPTVFGGLGINPFTGNVSIQIGIGIGLTKRIF